LNFPQWLPSGLRTRQDLAALMILGGILLATFLIYRPGFSGPLLLDDTLYLTQNQVSSLAPDALMQRALSGTHGFRASRAIPRLSFAVTQYWSGDGASYRLKQQNLLLHLANGLLVFWLIWLLAREVSSRRATDGREPSSVSPAWFALAAAAVWLLHPLQVSTVLYITQRFVLTAAFFMLAALICYVKGRSMLNRRPVAGMFTALAGVALFGFLGILSKTIAGLLPLLILAIEWFGFAGRDRMQRRRAVALLMVLLVGVPLVLGALYVVPRIDNMLAFQPGRGFSGVERLMTQAHVVALYLKLYFVPIPGTMSLFHDSFPVTRHLNASTLFLGIAYAGIAIVALMLRKRAPLIGLGIVWFFICHLMESTILGLELVFEHRNYLAILGLTLTTLSAAVLLLRQARLQRLAAPATLTLFVILGLNTGLRAADWGSLDRLLAVELRRDPTSPRVLTELVNYSRAQGQHEAAVVYLNRLLALDLPDGSAELSALYTYCNKADVPPKLYQAALAKLRSNLISPSTVSRLGLVVDTSLRGNCSALDPGELFALTEAVRTSNKARSLGHNCAAAEMQVRLFMQRGDWDQAKHTLGTVVDRCSLRKQKMMQMVLENILRFAITQGMLERTMTMLAEVGGNEERGALLDQVYAAVGGFDRSWVLENLTWP